MKSTVLFSIETVSVSSIETVSVSSIETVSVSSIETVSVSSIETVSVSSIETVSVSSIETVSVSSIVHEPKSAFSNIEKMLSIPRTIISTIIQKFRKSGNSQRKPQHCLKERSES